MPSLKIDVENKKVFTTPHATVVLVNGQVTSPPPGIFNAT
jgi:hypothetical protein